MSTSVTRQFRHFGVDGAPQDLSVCVRSKSAEVRWVDRALRLELSPRPDGSFVVRFEGGRILRARLAAQSRRVRFQCRGVESVFELFDPRTEPAAPASSPASSEIKAAMPGRVVEIKVKAGDRVSAGDVLLILEAMKMQNEIRADADAVISRIECEKGAAVEAGAVLVRF